MSRRPSVPTALGLGIGGAVLAFVVLAMVWLFQPTYRPTDEASHVAYARELSHGRLPTIDSPIPGDGDRRLTRVLRSRDAVHRTIWTAYNDSLAFLTSTCALAAMVVLLLRGPSGARLAAVAATAALAALTRASGLLVAGWFYLRNRTRYGDLTGSGALLEQFGRVPRGTTLGTLTEPDFWRSQQQRLWGVTTNLPGSGGRLSRQLRPCPLPVPGNGRHRPGRRGRAGGVPGRPAGPAHPGHGGGHERGQPLGAVALPRRPRGLHPVAGAGRGGLPPPRRGRPPGAGVVAPPAPDGRTRGRHGGGRRVECLGSPSSAWTGSDAGEGGKAIPIG
jgi:hypothetical protein